MIYVGIDVHNKRCTATLKQESGSIIQQSTFDNMPSGINSLLTILNTMGESKVVVESTGNYWIRIHDMLEDNGIDTRALGRSQLIQPGPTTRFAWLKLVFDSLLLTAVLHD